MVEPTSVGPENAGPLTVLVVDDDPTALESAAQAVEALGHECVTANDGLDAWEKQLAHPADVILSDWLMPRMNGLELCRRVRTLDESSYTYFIFMSGLGDKAHVLEGIRAGADDYLPKPADLDDLAARLISAARVTNVHRTLADRNSALRRESQTFFVMAHVDPLTGVGNRRKLDEDLAVIMSRASRYGERYSAALCDVDHFKAYNDHFGHLAGDTALRRVATAIRKTVRLADSVYRYGGEEFLVMLPGQGLAEAKQAMERVRASVIEQAIFRETAMPKNVVTISSGVAELDPKLGVEAWLQQADAALYRAKALGRDRVEADPLHS